MKSNIVSFPQKQSTLSEKRINPISKSSPITSENIQKPKTDIVNMGLFKLKKSLKREGFEIVEDQKGKITLVVRVAK